MTYLVEIRGDVDAVVQATPGSSRMSVVREVLQAWAEKKRHEAMLIQRVMRGKGSGGET